jgi:hypothetical protein
LNEPPLPVNRIINNLLDTIDTFVHNNDIGERFPLRYIRPGKII